MRRRLFVPALALVGAMILGATLSMPAAQAAAQLKDAFGRQFAPRTPKRIVSTAPSTTEILFALGLGPAVAGVTSDCDYPAAARQKPKIGKFAFINAEVVLALKPDLVVAPADMRPRLEPLRKVDAPVMTFAATDLPGVLTEIKAIGTLGGHAKEAEVLVKALAARVAKVEAAVKRLPRRPKVFHYLWNEPLMSSGTNSFIGDVLARAGADNVAGVLPSGFASFGLEALLAKGPELIVAPKTLEQALRKDLASPRWRGLPAAKPGRVLIVEDALISRPGPRSVDALERIHQAVARIAT